MSHQTALDWLMDQLDDKDVIHPLILWKAKEMEKEQIENAFQDGKWDWADHIANGTDSKDLAEYYNDTFVGEQDGPERRANGGGA